MTADTVVLWMIIAYTFGHALVILGVIGTLATAFRADRKKHLMTFLGTLLAGLILVLVMATMIVSFILKNCSDGICL